MKLFDSSLFILIGNSSIFNFEYILLWTEGAYFRMRLNEHTFVCD